jgi:hypothetical protein
MRAASFWNVTVPRVMSSYAIVIFVILWVGFITALLVNPEWLDSLWNSVRALPPAAEIIVWLLFLPIMTGLWAWQSSWTALASLLALAGIIIWTLVAVSSFVKAMR